MNATVERNADVSEAAVTATIVREAGRLACLPRFFGKRCAIVEGAVFSWLGRLCKDYRGGSWNFYELSNGGFYMAVKTDKKFMLTCYEGNGFKGEVSADAAGIIACLMAFSHLSFQTGDDRIIEAFHNLREFVSTHREARLIFLAID